MENNITWYTCECGVSCGYMPWNHKSKKNGKVCRENVTSHVFAKVPGLSKNLGPVDLL